MTRAALALGLALFAAPSAHAQFTGGVFGPVVKEGASSAEYRASVDFDGPGGGTDIAQRVHYQASLSGRFQLRGVVASRTVGDDRLDFDFVQAELTWQITPDGQAYQTGLRFDGRLRDGNRPGQLGLNWTNQWALGEGWAARAVALSAVQFGDNSKDGVSFSARGQVARTLDGGPTVGAQVYSSLGDSDNFRLFSKTSTLAGPFVAFPLGDGVSLRTGALFGLTDSSRDTQLRVWLGKSF